MASDWPTETVPLDQLHYFKPNVTEPSVRLRKPSARAHMLAVLESIAEQGLVNPLVVHRDGRQLVVREGMSRLWALRQLGYTEAPCIVVNSVADIQKARVEGCVPVDGFVYDRMRGI